MPTLLAVLAVQTWFTPGTVIATGDLPPPIVPGTEYQSHWNGVGNGEGSPSFEIVAVPYFEGQRIVESLGMGPGGFQRLWLSVLFAGSAAAAVFFAFPLLRVPLAAGTAGVLVTFNAHRMVTGPDPVPLAAFIVAALLSGLILRAGLRREQASGVLPFVVVSAGLGFVFANPPHFALVLVWVSASVALVAAFAGRQAARAALAFVLRATPLALVVNAWWLVPAALTILDSGFGERYAAEGVDAWAWTHARASLTNALALNTSWAWSKPEYYPFAASLDRAPLEFLRYLPFVLAVVGVLLARARERRLALSLLVIGLVGVGVAKGLHEPLPVVNRWLYDHLPGYWLFRDPAKVLLLVSFVFALLGGLAVARLVGTERLPRWLGVGLAALGLGGALAYAYPLLTGDVIPDKRPLLPSAHVTVSRDWQRASVFLNEAPNPGKVVILPRGDFYQLPTTWGYYGVSFARLAIRRPVIENQAGAYFKASEALSGIVAALERDLLEGRSRDAAGKLMTVGAGYVLLRYDLDRDFPGREIADPRVLEAGLTRIPGLERVRAFGDLQVYRLAPSSGREVVAAIPVSFVGEGHLIPEAIDALPRRGALVTEVEDAEETMWSMGGATSVHRLGGSVRQVSVRTEDEELAVRLTDVATFQVGDRRLASTASEKIRFPGVSPPAAVTVGATEFLVDRQRSRWTELGTVDVPGRTVLRAWSRESNGPVLFERGVRVGDCARSGSGGLARGRLSARVVRRDRQPTLRLTARAGSACVSFRVTPFRRNGLYRISFDYRSVAGEAPRVCLWEERRERCAPLSPLAPTAGWRRFDEVVAPTTGTEALRLFFYADAPDEGVTVTEYRNAAVGVYRSAGRRPTHAGVERVGRLTLPKGRTTTKMQSPTVPTPSLPLRAIGPVGDCNRFDERTAFQVGLSSALVRRDGIPTIRLAAQDHSACVSVPVAPFDPKSVYDVRLAYRGVSGSPPRLCLWEEGPDRCASLPPFDASSGWHRFETRFEPAPETEGIRVFLYADGSGEGVTVTEYRDISVAPSTSVGLIGIPAGHRLPMITYRRSGPGEFQLRISGATDPFLLSVTEAFASGWRLERTPNEQTGNAVHVAVNGYANGWVIPWRGTYELRIVYGPERLARAARWLSSIALTIAVILLVASRTLRMARRWCLPYGRIPAKRRWLVPWSMH